MADVDIESLSDTELASLRQKLGIKPPGTLTATERYLIWFFGTVVAGVVPIACAAVISGSWVDEIYNGQLLISAVAVFGAAATGCYVAQVAATRHRSIRTAVVVSAIPFISAASILYQGFAGVDRSDPDAHSTTKVAAISYVIGGAALIAGAANTYIASEAGTDD
jgi:hypothetical protein